MQKEGWEGGVVCEFGNGMSRLIGIDESVMVNKNLLFFEQKAAIQFLEISWRALHGESAPLYSVLIGYGNIQSQVAALPLCHTV